MRLDTNTLSSASTATPKGMLMEDLLVNSLIAPAGVILRITPIPVLATNTLPS
jgi:hypothetical protein